MLFNSIVFCVFLFFIVPMFYWIKKDYRKYFLILASYVFYGYWDYRFLGLIFISTVVDFAIGKKIFTTDSPIQRKRLLLASLGVNLSILGFFKYYNFFIESFSGLLSNFGTELDFLHLNVILPVGISFYTFQTLSYTFDIYRKKLKPTNSFWDFSLFVAFFPQLVAGPIERAVHLLPQIENIGSATKRQIKEGISLITIGMFKKVLIGDTCGRFVDHIFTEPQLYQSSELIFALLMFTIQIYADFSGYSTIARGTAKLFGVDLMHNFNQPYLSSNITEFWRRWHISLSSWLKEYLYIFWLGGNRKGKNRTHFNLMMTMLLGGLWHGASWNFVIWGGIHGIALIVHKKILGSKKPNDGFAYESPKNLAIHVLKVLGTFMIVVTAWLFFRIPDFESTMYILEKMVMFDLSDITLRLLKISAVYFFIVFLIDIIEYRTGKKAFLLELKPSINISVTLVSWVCILNYLLTIGKPMPFIYFQF